VLPREECRFKLPIHHVFYLLGTRSKTVFFFFRRHSIFKCAESQYFALSSFCGADSSKIIQRNPVAYAQFSSAPWFIRLGRGRGRGALSGRLKYSEPYDWFSKYCYSFANLLPRFRIFWFHFYCYCYSKGDKSTTIFSTIQIALPVMKRVIKMKHVNANIIIAVPSYYTKYIL